MVQCWCYKGVSAGGDCSDKIFSQRDYELFLSSLSDVMLKNPESNVQARSLIMEFWECGSLYQYRKAAVNTSNYTVSTSGVFAGLIVNWRREDIYKTDEEKEIEKKEILDMMSFAKDCFPEKFELFKEVMIENLRLCGREGMEESINYDDLAKELFFELEKTTLPPGGDSPRYNLRTRSKAHDSKKTSLPVDDGPQSELRTPSVSGVSSYKKKSVFTLSGNK
ncbi:hypothetical protein [Wolbachia pipientis]|uniref:hypothetical protein n=1 Tax=Wolbachia pipientis TaxID=955 RepID=UPI002872B89A|nr:hypothetical protein [Wolbachia pipientis]